MQTALLGSLASGAGAGIAEAIALGSDTLTLNDVTRVGNELDVLMREAPLEGQGLAPTFRDILDETQRLRDLIQTEPKNNAWAIRVSALRFAKLHGQLKEPERTLFADSAARAAIIFKNTEQPAGRSSEAETERFTSGAIVRVGEDSAPVIADTTFKGVDGGSMDLQSMLRIRADRRDHEINGYKLLGEQSVWDDAKLALNFLGWKGEASSWRSTLEYIGALGLMNYLMRSYDNPAVSLITIALALVGLPIGLGRLEGYRPFDKFRGDRALTSAEAGKFYERGKFHLLAAGAYKRAAQEMQDENPAEAATFYMKAGDMYLKRRLGHHALYAYSMGLSLLDENQNDLAFELIDKFEKSSLCLETQEWVRSLRWERLGKPQAMLRERILLGVAQNEISLAAQLEKVFDFSRAIILYLDAHDHLSAASSKSREATDLREEVWEMAQEAVLKMNKPNKSAVAPSPSEAQAALTS